MDFIVKNSGHINIVFLHGWGADYQSFSWLKNYIKTCTLHFANLDGFGGQPAPTDPTVDGYAHRLKQYILDNNLNNVVLVGHSFGGRVAIQYASQNQVKGLVLVDAAGIKPKKSIKKSVKVLKYKLTKFLVKHKLVNNKKLQKYGSVDYKNADNLLKQVLVSAVNYDQSHLLTKITAKTLIFWGENDKDTPLYMAKKLHKNIKNSELVVLTGGHFSFADNPYQFYKVLEYFINNL